MTSYGVRLQVLDADKELFLTDLERIQFAYLDEKVVPPKAYLIIVKVRP